MYNHVCLAPQANTHRVARPRVHSALLTQDHRQRQLTGAIARASQDLPAPTAVLVTRVLLGLSKMSADLAHAFHVLQGHFRPKRERAQTQIALLARWGNGRKLWAQPRRQRASGMHCVTRASTGLVAHASTVKLALTLKSLVVRRRVRSALLGRGPQGKQPHARPVGTASIQQLLAQLPRPRVAGVMLVSGRLSAAALGAGVTHRRRH